MNTKKLNRIFARTMYVMVIAVLVFSVTGSAYAQEPTPWLRAHPEWESVDGWYWPLGAQLQLTIEDPNTAESPDLEMSKIVDVVTEPPENNSVWFDFAGIYDLKPGDIVILTDGMTVRELTVSNVAITSIDLQGNRIKGTAWPGTEVRLPIPEERFVTANENGDWEVNFGDVDIVRDMTVIAEVYDKDESPGDLTSYEHYIYWNDGEHLGSEGVVHANSCNAYGWAIDLDDLSREVAIRIQSNGETLANRATEGNGFYFNLYGLIENYQEYQITAQAYDEETESWSNLDGTPKSLICANYDLYIFDTKTGKAERLTINLPNTGEYNPSWSNNGKQIVHDVADANSHALYITDVKTKVSTKLPGGDGGNDASWSPNGKWIVFDRRWFDNDTNLYLLPPKGGTPTLVVSNATNVDWSPDSQRLIFERDGGLWTASVNGTDEQQIVEAGYGPAWSPDGLWIAYDLDGDIWKIAVDEFGARAGDPIQLTSGPVSEGGTTWSQNGEFIVFASDATGDHDIWQIAAEGGIPTQLRGAIGYGDYDPDYSNNGQYIAYEGAMEPSVPHIESDTWLNTYALADWPVGQLINVSIDDPTTSKKPDYRTSFTPDGTSNWYLFQPGLDVQPGFVITAKSKFFTKTLIVSNLAATDVDAGSGMVSGVATPNNSFYMVADGDHFRLPSGQGVSVDENGNWTADFSGAEAPRPWTWYTGGEMFEWDVDGDMTHSFWHLHQEVIEVWLPYNEIRAFDWPLNTNLKFYVDGDEIATALTEPAVWMNGTWAVVNTGDLQLQPGMMITVTDGVTAKDMIIQDIKITKIDADNDLVYGYGPADANLELGSWEDSPVFRFFNADGDGNWVVDYRTPSVNGVTVDLNPADDIRLFARDAEKDATVWEAITYPPLYLRINYGHEWMESFYEAGHEVVITVTNSEGAEKATATVFTEPKDFWGGQAGFQTAPDDWSPAPPDIQPYDWVYARVDNGATAQVQIGDISGALDLNTDSIEGTINAPWFTDAVQVECLDWGSGHEPPFDNKDGGFILTDGENPYSCSWAGEWDIQYYQNVGVGYSSPDGHWVANAFFVPNPHFSVFPEWDYIEAWDWPVDATVTVAIADKPECSAKGVSGHPDWDPNSLFVPFWLPEDCDVVVGNVVTLTDGVTPRTYTVQNLTITEVDKDDNTIAGTADAGAMVHVWPHGYNELLPTTGEDGNWLADFNSIGIDLMEGMGGRTEIRDEVGNATAVEWRILNPFIEAAPYSDWIHAREWPIGTEMTLEIDDPSDGLGDVDYSEIAFMQQAPWNPGDPNDIVADFRWPDQFAPGPGYVLTMSGNGQSKTLTISQLTVTSFDLGADTVSGTGTPNAQIQVCANLPDRCITRWVTAAEGSGDWTADYGVPGTGNDDPDTYDVQPGSNGWAADYEADSDRTWFDWWVPNPRFVVFPEWEWFDGNDWPDGAKIDITVAGKPECTTWGVSSGNFFNGGFPENCDIVVDDEVTFTYGETIRTHTVRNLAITSVDQAANTVSGMSDPNEKVYVWQHEPGPQIQFEANASGEWFADLNGVYDIRPGAGGRSEIRDEFGNSTAVDWWIPEPPPPSRTLEVGNFYVEWSQTNPEEVIYLSWKESPNLASSCTPPNCLGSFEFFGNSWVSENEGTTDFFFASLVGGGTTGSWTQAGTTVDIYSVCLGCWNSADTPVHTSYQFFDNSSKANLIAITRTFEFGETLFTHAIRAFIPRLYPFGGFNQVVYRDVGGNLVVTGAICDFGCQVAGWDGNWFAIHNPTTGQGVILQRIPSTIVPALWLDWDAASFTNASNFLLLAPEGGFTGAVTETEYLCFYDGNTWIPSLTLPEGCQP